MAGTIATPTESVTLIKKENSIATITLNRPAAMNSLNQELLEGFLAALHDVESDRDVRVVVLTGSGRAFSAGGDLFFLVSLTDPVKAREFIDQAGLIPTTIMNMAKPVIAMVNGVAAGAGFNFALACDLILCAKSARFGQSFAKVGLVPDCGGQYLLPRIVGPYKAKELMFLGDLIDADTALGLGLVNRVIPDDQLALETYKLANRLAHAAPLPLSAIKRVVNMSGHLDLRATLALETDTQTVCMQTADHKEGVKAFKEKREPVFTGR
jgi:2-(1,2-epoxy-1,2-dihydrophenyl)acetyl-CoA isomerase